MVLSFGESRLITRAMAWDIGRLGPVRTHLVPHGQGIATEAALGIAAPLGFAIEGRFGVAALTALMPTAAAVSLFPPAVPGEVRARVPFQRKVGLICRLCLVLMRATVPFTPRATLLPLDFAARN